MSFTPAPLVRPRLCVGGCLDIPAGRYYRAKHGDMILSGGFTNFIGAGGRGNTFKTALLLTLCLIVLKRYGNSSLVVYDAEQTFEWARIEDLCEVLGIDFNELLEEGKVILTSAAEHSGNEWWGIVRNEAEERHKDFKRLALETPFLNRKGEPIKVLPKRMHFLDSMSQLQTDAIEEIYKKNEIDAGAANTDALRGAAIKTRLVMQAPSITEMGGMTLLATAHIGDEMKLEQYAAFKQQLQFLKKGLKFKNCPEKFTFLTSICYVIAGAEPLLNQSDKAPEYPAEGFKDATGDTDLQELDLIIARSKHGPSGHNFTLLVSQTEGFQPTLTEYHFLRKRKDKFGLIGPEGVSKDFRLELYPEFLMRRKQIRKAIKEDKKLCRALEITSELAQIYDYWVDYPRERIVSPKDIYDKLTEMGYDWNVLLDTRGHWTYDHYTNPVKPISTMDLINMYFGEYIPWWFTKEQKDKIDLTKAVKCKLASEEIVYAASADTK